MSLLNAAKRAFARPLSTSIIAVGAISLLTYSLKLGADTGVEKPSLTAARKMHIESIPMCRLHELI